MASAIDTPINDTETVDIDALSGIPRNKLHILVARAIAEDTLEKVNADSVAACPKDSFYSRYGKRLLDIVLSLVAVAVTLPFNLVFGICTFFDVGRPLFYRETRIGKDGKPFTIAKFRNMTNETDENGTLLPAHQRVTKFGRFMRQHSLDELLYFWFILIGKMSFVGPRPLHPEYEDRYSERHRTRHAVRPGLECPPIRGNRFVRSWFDQFENDVWYVENVSFSVDVKMLLAVARMAFDKKDSSMRGNAARGGFMGYYKDGTSINSHSVPVRYVEAAQAMYEIEKSKA